MTPPDDSILVELHKPGEPDKEKHFYLGEELGKESLLLFMLTQRISILLLNGMMLRK